MKLSLELSRLISVLKAIGLVDIVMLAAFVVTHPATQTNLLVRLAICGFAGALPLVAFAIIFIIHYPNNATYSIPFWGAVVLTLSGITATLWWLMPDAAAVFVIFTLMFTSFWTRMFLDVK